MAFEDDPYNTTEDSSAPRFHGLKLRPELLDRPSIYLPFPRVRGKTLWEMNVLRQVETQIQQMVVLLQRPPSQEEVDAFVPICSHATNRQRLGFPVGIALGFAHTYLGIGKTISPETPRPQSLQSFLSTFSKISWRPLLAPVAFRVGIWTMISYSFFTTYARYKEAVEIIHEPRLEQFRNELRQVTAEDVRRRKLEHSNRVWQARQAEKRAATQKDDSATHSSFEQTSSVSADTASTSSLYPNSDQSASANDGFSSMQPSSPPGYGHTDVRHGRWQQSVSPTPGSPVQNESLNSSGNGSSSDFFDDPSPVSPEYRPNQSASTTNAWDRVRQGKNKSANPGPTPIQGSSFPNAWDQRNRTDNDSSSYLNEERLRQQEKEKAQREFDRMLEAERGASRNDQSPILEEKRGGWKRW